MKKEYSELCAMFDCERPNFGNGYCEGHWEDARAVNATFSRRRRGLSVEARFWQYVIKTPECWIWMGGQFSGGYGQFYLNGKTVLAHRISYAFEYGSMPILNVLHSCDNPPCVRPDHLTEGTHNKNMLDRSEKGRQAKGESNGRTILTELDVIHIRGVYKRGSHSFGAAALAVRYGMATTTVQCIVKGQSWRHLLDLEKL